MAILDVDELTGAYRRAGLDPTLDHLLRESRATGAPLSLAVLDIDHFKTLNDGFGHALGDEVLREVVARASAALRDEDLVFRYGGDEFVVLLPTTEAADAAAVLERVRRRVRDRPIEASTPVRVQLSVGVASSRELAGEADAEALFGRADARLLSAKRRGRDRLVADDLDDGEALPQVRLLQRDAALAAIDGYLAGPTGPGGAGAAGLRLVGPRGAGFTRLLDEAAIRARLRGRRVRRVRGSAAQEGVHLAALTVDAGTEPPDEDALRERMARDAEELGLVLLIEGGERLDPDGRALLVEAAGGAGVWTIEACPDDARAALPAIRTARLAALDGTALEAWLRAALGGAASPALLQAAREAGGGLPGPTSRWLLRGRRTGALRTGADGWRWDEEVAPLHAPDDAPGVVRVPRWEAPLVGRSTLLARWRHELAEERLVVLVGPGGTGKSRLAAQLAHELADGAPGGTDWIDLRGVRRGDDLIGAIGRQAGLGPVASVGDLAHALGPAPRRLVLDDADRIAGDAGRAGELLAALPGLRLLVTSRRPLRLEAERVIEVPGLDGPGQAAALLRRRIRRTRGRGALPDPDTERALLEQLDGSPLAIELAAAWTRILAPAALTAALARRPALLGRAPGLRDRAARTVDLTAELMAPDERERLGTLALLEAGFEADEAERAADASPFFLVALLDRSLLQREGARYRMHALVAERFASGLRDPAAARARVADAYAALAGRLNALDGAERSTSGYRRVDAEFDNLRLAWEVATDPPDAARLWPLARLLRGWCDVRGRVRDGLELFGRADAALAASDRAGAGDGSPADDVELRAWVREAWALFLSHDGRHAEAERAAREAAEMVRDLPPGETAALAHNTLGIARAYRGDVDGAREAFTESARLRARTGDAVGEAQAHGNLALLSDQAGRPDEARAALRDAVVAYRRVDHASGLAVTLARLAALERRRARDADGASEAGLDEALRLAAEAREVAARIGFAAAEEDAEAELAEGLLAAGRPAEAVPHAARALTLAERREAPGRLAASRLRHARAAAEAGDLATARAEADALARAPGDAVLVRGRLALAARVALADGDPVAAGRYLGAAAPATASDGAAGAAHADVDAWWRALHAAWSAADVGPEARAAFDEGRNAGPDGVAPPRHERRGSAA